MNRAQVFETVFRLGAAAWAAQGPRGPMRAFVLHRSADPEDYDLVCDFTALLGGAYGRGRRPELAVWAGRSDFDPDGFAARLRQACVDQIERIEAQNWEAEHSRAQLRDAQLRAGAWGLAQAAVGLPLLFLRLNPVVGTMLLAVSVAGGRQATQHLSGLVEEAIHRVLLGQMPGAQGLERRARDLRSALDQALASPSLTIHRELWTRAGSSGRDTPTDDWPLPPWVRAELR